MEHFNTTFDIDDEPVGIVISGGSLPEPEPRFWAYVWGQQEEEPGLASGVAQPA
ncbi:MAG: hypothetical protein IPK85_25105 [Gemmatimonadetes bacterium]|nr:hypothetical protein [Gemmatimonadota bacterium]